MDTTALLLITIKEGCQDMFDRILDMADGAGYSTPEDNPTYADIVLMADSNGRDEDDIAQELIDEARSSDLDEAIDVEVILLDDDNADDWKDFFGLDDWDEDIVEALVGEDSSYLRDPGSIRKYLEDHYIGKFDDDEEMAEHLAKDDPKIQALDEDIVRHLDLEGYYSDVMRYDMWNDGQHWFWN